MKLRVKSGTLFIALLLLWATGAPAQTLTPPTPQFDILGFIQEATLDTAGAICAPPTGDTRGRLRGGTLTVNGIKMIVPCHTLLQLPAATFTWADLFDSTFVSAPVGAPINTVPVPVPPLGQSGLALADTSMPFPSFEVRVQGNVVGKNADGTDRYIVGLIVPITQQGLNAGSGIINCIDYVNSTFRVGGILNNCTTGALIQINDPVGRWGAIHSPDPRFSGDFENSTISASTGIPVCIPRVAPPGNDPLCPLKNRPKNNDLRFGLPDPFLAPDAPRKKFDMPTPAAASLDATLPDPRQQVPMTVGDQVNWAGTLFMINPALTRQVTIGTTVMTVPDWTPANTYISAHTIEDVLGIFTAPGVPPAYVAIEDLLTGTNGAALPGLLQEASTRLTVVGFTTDPTRLIDIYADDVNPCTGVETQRLLATVDPASDAIKGRFVYRVLGGLFMPPTRNYTMKSRTGPYLDPTTGLPALVANGIQSGQFLLPNFEFIFPENHQLGDPLIPFNFQDLPFLAQGSGPLDPVSTGDGLPVLGQLDPWPGIPAPPKAICGLGGAAPIVNAGPDISVASGAQVKLLGNVTWDPNSTNRTVQWTGPPVTWTSPTNQLNTSFTAPLLPGTLSFTLTAQDSTGVAVTDTVIVTVLPAGDIVQITLATWATQNGKRGGFGKLAVTATTNNPAAILSLTQINRANGDSIIWGAGSTKQNAPGIFDWIEIKGVPEPASLIVTSDKGGSAIATCGAQDAKGRITCQ